MAGERTLPGLGLTGFWTAGSDGWNSGMDANLRLLSALGQLSVISRTTTLPGSPANGSIYIVPSGAGSNPNAVAIRDNGAWVYVTPLEGFRAWVRDVDQTYVFDGSAWIRETQPVDMGTFIAGTPAGSETVLRYVFTRATTFADELAGSHGSAGVAATAVTTFSVKKNGSDVGTVAFGVGGSIATFTTTGTTVSFASGDVLSIVAPATPDATLADISITLTGMR